MMVYDVDSESAPVNTVMKEYRD